VAHSIARTNAGDLTEKPAGSGRIRTLAPFVAEAAKAPQIKSALGALSNSIESEGVKMPNRPFILIVAGSRFFHDYDFMERHLDYLLQNKHPNIVIREGEAPGADKLARRYAEARGYEVQPFPADWSDLSQPDAIIKTRVDGSKYDAKAGNRRNVKMATTEPKPDAAVLFFVKDIGERMAAFAETVKSISETFGKLTSLGASLTAKQVNQVESYIRYTLAGYPYGKSIRGWKKWRKAQSR
jgi:hypothetical protein